SRPRWMRSRYLLRLAALRAITRCVTLAIMGCRSVMPARSVALDESDARRGSPCPRRIGDDPLAALLPPRDNTVDPCPLRFHLVAPHEERRVAFQQVEQQPLIGNAPPVAREM